MKFENKFYNRGDYMKSGAVILESRKAWRAGFIVLAVIPKNRNYVVLFMTDEKQFLLKGHHHDLYSALDIFNKEEG